LNGAADISVNQPLTCEDVVHRMWTQSRGRLLPGRRRVVPPGVSPATPYRSSVHL